MCCCGKATVNGTPGYSWDGKTFGVYPLNPPTLGESDALIFDEPGRCGGMDSHSFHYRIVRLYGSLDLLVAHGGGEERFRVSLPHLEALAAMDSHARYWLLNAIYHAHSDGERRGEEATAKRYREAFASDRLRKRKVRGRDAVKIWIES